MGSARLLKAVRWGALALAALSVLGGEASAQKLLDRDKPRTHSANDPYTKGGDPELVKAAGYVAIGSEAEFEFGPSGQNSKSLGEHLPYLDLYWAETAHFKICVSLPKVKVTGKERDKIRAELTRMQERLPEVDPRTRQLDPWLRMHLYAQRMEDHYREMQSFLGVEDAMFAELNGTHPMGQEYLGIGPYMGMQQKYELVILPSEGSYTDFMRNKIGLTTKTTQFWAYNDRGALSVMTHLDLADVRVDEGLHGHVIHSMTTTLLNGYRHYSYDLPVWVLEGCAHWFERRINPRFNSFTSSEGSSGVRYNKEDWSEPVRKGVKSGKLPSFPTMLNRRAYAELELGDHLKSWSLIEFLQTKHPEFLKRYFAVMCSMLDEGSIPDASNMADVQRAVFKDELGMTYAQFDRAWEAWVVADED